MMDLTVHVGVGTLAHETDTICKYEQRLFRGDCAKVQSQQCLL